MDFSRQSAGSSSSIDARNASYAVREKLAYSRFFTDIQQESSLTYHVKESVAPPASSSDGNKGASTSAAPAPGPSSGEEKDVVYMTPELAAAKRALQCHVVESLRELQRNTGMALVRPAIPLAQLQQLRQEAESALPWEQIGIRGNPFVLLPPTPPKTEKQLFGSMALLMALAGHLVEDDAQKSQSASQSNWRPISAAPSICLEPFTLPRCLGMTTFLPALRNIRAPSMEWLWAFFSDMKPQQRHVGVDDRLHAWYRELKIQAAAAVLKEGSITLCRSFCRFGVPHGLRASVWELALGLGPPNSEADETLLNDLCKQVQTHRSLLDTVICEDLVSVMDSEHYFLFEEMLRAIGLAFMRDRSIPHRCSVEPHPELAPLAGASVLLQHKMAAASSPVSPPESLLAKMSQQQQAALGGVVPVKGLTMLAAPLCFMYKQPGSVYRLFRAMYCRFWCKLHSLSPVGAPAPALPVLVKTFESLAQELDPDVVAHVHRLGVPVSALGLPWISCAFVGYMPVEEVLLLWDRVIGLDSLLPIPLLAVAILCFRRQVILSCNSTQELLEAMSDLSQMQTVPLLQAVLFQG